MSKSKKQPKPYGGSLHERGHFSNQGKGEMSHDTFHALDHDTQHDHHPHRDGEADGHGDDI